MTLKEIIENGASCLTIPTPTTLFPRPENAIQFVLDKFQQGSSLSDSLKDDIRFVVSEGIANAAVWGNCLDPSKKIKIFTLWKGKYFYLVIKDEGKGFDINNPIYHASPPEGSLGLMYMKKLAEMVYNFNDNALYIIIKKPSSKNKKSIK